MTLRERARALKRDVIAIWLAARDARTPWCARALALVIAAYVLSPVDLVPDFIPILGLLDELILVPLGIWLVLRLMPPRLMDECRARAATIAVRPRSTIAAGFVVVAWVALAALAGWLAYRHFAR